MQKEERALLHEVAKAVHVVATPAARQRIDWAMAALGGAALDRAPIGDEQIKHMVNRFLGWKLPAPWHPDNGISFKPVHSPGFEPTGTNLFDATQAEEMIRYMLAGLPTD